MSDYHNSKIGKYYGDKNLFKVKRLNTTKFFKVPNVNKDCCTTT